jgi:DNA-binding transcriptional regulator YiaG
MKYESYIAEMIHENAIAEFRLGLITEAELREYDELCLPPEALHSNIDHEIVNIVPSVCEHTALVTA